MDRNKRIGLFFVAVVGVIFWGSVIYGVIQLVS